ncbi:MAG: protein kinase family protein [Angustibacter sp.]
MLQRRLGEVVGSSTWQAHDETLDRLVFVRVVSRRHPRAEAVLDAARQAASVEDPRLVRVLDVGQDQQFTYVVNEWITAPDLATRLNAGPLPSNQVRIMVGETALALEAARYRGLHHLQLTPAHVYLLDDGAVRVTELAVAAALAGPESGLDGLDGERATALDTRDVVALAYGALTGTWPLPGGQGGPCDLPQAPRSAGRPVLPSQLVAGVPADLDALCARTFDGSGPPRTPGELASQITPWPADRVASLISSDSGGPADPTVNAGGSSGWFTPAVAAAGQPPAPPAPAPLSPPSTASTMPVVGAARIGASGAPSTPAGPGVDDPHSTSPHTQPIDDRWITDEPTADAHPHHASGHPVLGRVPGDVPAIAPARTASSAHSRPWLQDEWSDEPDGGSSWETGRQPPPRQPRTVIGLVVGFLGVLSLLAYCGLRDLGGIVPRPATRSTASASSPQLTPTERTTTRPVPSSQGIPVLSGRGLDPEGDGSEKDESARLAFDDDPSTAWTTDTYRSQQFGGLKSGVGLLLELGQPRTVTAVAVQMAVPGSTVQLRTVDGEQLGQDVLASADSVTGLATLQLDQSVTTDNLVLWFTVPAAVDDGFRVEVAEVDVS